MSAMQIPTGASRNAIIQGDHTHAPVGLDTDSVGMADLAMVLDHLLNFCAYTNGNTVFRYQ